MESGMFNLTEIMQAAHSGQAFDTMARQFGLTPQQARSAVEALLPAFSLGLQRQTQSLQMLSALLAQVAAAQQQASAYDNPAAAFSPYAAQQGQGLIGIVFGDPEVARQIAAQAAAMSGVSMQILQQMMPFMATMLMGGMNRTMMNGLQNAGYQMPPQAGAGFPGMPDPRAFSDMFGRMMGAGAMGSAPKPAPAPEPAASQASAFEQMMTNNPFAAMLAGMMRAASAPSGDAKEEEPPPPPPTAAELNYEAVSQLFQTGRDVQDQYLRNLQDIFSKMLGQPARPD
jgi:hypothetical protein